MKTNNIKKNITTIDEGARRFLDITRDEYALCQYVQFRAADPRQRVPGRCCDPKESIADFIGITRPGLYKMLDRLAGIGLLDIDSATGAIGVLPVWMDTMSVNKVDSLQELSVNKVNSECKQSLQTSVNKVTHNIEVKEEYSKSIVRSNTRANALPVISINLDASWSYPELAQQAVGTWMEYKKAEKKGSYKTQKSFDIALNQWKKMSNANGKRLLEIVEHSISQGWSGLYIPKDYSTQKFTGGAARPVDQPARYTPPPSPNPAELKEPKYRPL